MEILKLTREQDKALTKLIEIGLDEGQSEDVVRGKIMEVHVKEGWAGTPAQSLDKLSVGELGKALFSTYEIKKEFCRFQEYLVRFQLGKYTFIENRVLVQNKLELDKDDVIELSVENIKRLSIEVNPEEADVQQIKVEYGEES